LYSQADQHEKQMPDLGSVPVYRFGGMFLLPISEHLPVRLHESLLDAETLKPALSRQ